MCGIAGAAWTDERLALDGLVLARMQEVMKHRGPDERGVFQTEGAALAHVRLSIIDLATGQQPLGNEDGTIQVVFNGEIYNFGELRRELLGRGHVFQTATDTEVIVHLYEDHGASCFRRLRGMFAIALWDGRRRRLVLARDRMGKKPLVYWQQEGRLAFASEIKALFEIPEATRKLNPIAVDQYFAYGYVPQPRTIYRGIAKLPPGCYGVYEGDRFEVRKYWEDEEGLEPGEQANGRRLEAASEEEWLERLGAALAEATRIRMVSDVPLGAFLSGGLDSSVICSLMQEHSPRPIKTFSIRFPAAEYDEGEYARAVARHLGTEHHEFYVTERSRDVVPLLVWHFDEPFADSSAIATYFVCKYARQEVTVALTGDGADELFCGYERHGVLQRAAAADWMPLSARRLLAAPIQAWPGSRRVLGRLRTMVDLAAEDAAGRYAMVAAVGFRPDWRAALYTPEFLALLGSASRSEDGCWHHFTPPGEQKCPRHPLDFAKQAYLRFEERCPRRWRTQVANAASLADQETYLPGDILPKVDIASMANSLECRSPFLDAEVVRLARAMPQRLKLRGGVGKYILRAAFGHRLPAVTLQRPKRGFVVPIRDWLRGEFRPLVQELLLDRESLGRGLFQPKTVRQLVQQHLSGAVDHTMRLWMLLWFELWHRTFIDAARPEPATL